MRFRRSVDGQLQEIILIVHTTDINSIKIGKGALDSPLTSYTFFTQVHKIN
jgi:hypothetical protein